MRVELIDVRGALEREEIIPCFQPQVELSNGRLAGFEVLARWQHPEQGLILPENFISLSEQNGLIGLLTEQILRKTFVAAPLVPEPILLAVNFSPIQLRDLSLPDQIRRVAEETGFGLERLTVEITEAALVENLENARKITSDLKLMGCRLALDDFGTGYSNLHHLQSLPFNQLEIDRSFVESVTFKRDSRKIVGAIVGLGHSLGMATLAEGVVTEEQADILLWLGCELGQGWLYGRPVPAERIPQVIRSRAERALPQNAIAGRRAILRSLEALPSQRLAELQAIYNGALVGLAYVDRNLRYVSLNQRYADLNGGTVADYIGKTVQEMIPETYARMEPSIRRALQGKPVEAAESTRPSPNPGAPDLTVLFSYEPAFDEAHEVIGLSAAILDITERKLAEQALRESEENLRGLVDVSPQIPWIADAGGNVVDISARWVELTGLSREQALNYGWLDALHPEDRLPTLKAFRVALQTGERFESEYRVRTADGGWRWMRARGEALRGPSGEVIRWYGGVEDIDERKQLEEALHNLRP